MKLQLFNLRIVEIKLGTYTVEFIKGIHFHLSIPYPTDLKVGDYIPFYTEVQPKRSDLS